MKFLWLSVALLCLATVANAKIVDEFTKAANSVKKQLDSMQRMLAAVTNQMMMQQYMLEERTRASGRTGVKTVRLRQVGTKTYFEDSHTSFGSLSLHDHSNNIRTVGLGEFSGVLNGIEFKTRHNDYRLYMPHTTNMSYGMVEEIPFPEVPPSVMNEPNVSLAILELQEYFRAWRDQNSSHRDYQQYFKPVLCYLEGGWTNSGEEIDEPFFSDRHFLDARNWMELQQKARFVSYSGSKSRLENLASLPTAVINMINGSIPEFAQFNYRIMCHPLKDDVPLDKFRVEDDLHLRIKGRRSIFQHKRSRAARFKLNPVDGDYEDQRYHRGYLDELMEQIPGRNNYPGSFYDDGLDMPALEWDGVTMKDASRYHRVYKIGRRDATGVSAVYRGFNDDYMFAAMTNHTKVSAMSVQKRPCKWSRELRRRVCTTLSQRWTWAFPLEIIYLTPLQSWNPYDLEYKGEARSDEGKSIEEGGRDGSCEKGKAFKGLNSKNYYMTPVELFGRLHSQNSADTVRGVVCVEDRNGVVRRVGASGVRAFVPTIGDVGSLRTRYPIFPVHEEANTIWKEMEATKELVMDKEKFAKYFWSVKDESGEDDDKQFELGDSRNRGVTPHRHRVSLTPEQRRSLMYGADLTVQTDTEAGHQHTLVMRYHRRREYFFAISCDGEAHCWDRHRFNPLLPVDESEN